jgi:hypothetical protein
MGIVWSFYIGGMTAAVRQGDSSESAEHLETRVKGVSAENLVQQFRQPHLKAPVPDRPMGCHGE